ncbi:hypothetical protein CS369_14860, partial [Candidatus Symbiopectobacterium sp. 'North America']|nr:hypothetical protein [Candidatus Symbiopectobacterium sp. 'North America']
MTDECIAFVITDRNSKSGIFQISLIAKIKSHVATSSFNEVYDEDAAVIHVGSSMLLKFPLSKPAVVIHSGQHIT